MKIEDLNPAPIARVHFTLSSYKKVPEKSGCYVLTTFDNCILYIGLSDNLSNRFQQHLGNPDKTNPTNEGRVVWFYFAMYDPKNLPQLERTWLNHFVALHGRFPVLNKVNSPIS